MAEVEEAGHRVPLLAPGAVGERGQVGADRFAAGERNEREQVRVEDGEKRGRLDGAARVAEDRGAPRPSGAPRRGTARSPVTLYRFTAVATIAPWL